MTIYNTLIGLNSLYPDFNVTEFRNIKNESGSNGFILSRKNWIKSTNAIGDES